MVLPRAASSNVVCKATNIKRSQVDSAWVRATVALYLPSGQPASDVDEVIVNLDNRTVVGPTNVTFCGDRDVPQPIDGYAAVPVSVVRSLGLQPCAVQASPTAPTSSLTSTRQPPTSTGSMVGSWGGHETGLTIDAHGNGTLSYPDLTRCPSCSMGNAPRGSMAFKLTAMTATSGTGSVTATSDAKNYAVGQSVVVTLAPASPGKFLQLRVGGSASIILCNAAAAGQCGA
ncbi:hypothetical protein [Flexivirga alba]|uniref:Uncharacterized protein n=1 Tax=Flexivirga alba TaxID=702742 RepID=A0ABW2AEP9_9MICO